MEYIENEYFDSDGKQLKPFPDKWMNAKKRFKPGQVIICKDLKHHGGTGYLVVKVPWVVYYKTNEQGKVPECLIAQDLADEGKSWTLRID